MPGGWDDSPKAGGVEKERWRAIWGECAPDAGGSSVFLRAKPPDDPVVSDKGSTTGSKALVMGSNAFAEGSFEIKFRIEGGDFSVFLNYVAEDDAVMLTLGKDSSAILTRNQPGRATGEKLAVEFLESPIGAGREHSLVLVTRSGALFTMLDGRVLFGGGVSLGDPRPRPGFVGAGVWSGCPGEAEAEILSARLRASLPRFAFWDEESVHDKTDIFAELERQAFRYDGIAPPWFSASDGMAGFQLVEDLDVIKIEAAKAFCGVWPRLKLSGKNPFGNIPQKSAAEAFKDGGFAGLYVDASELDETSLPLMRSWIASFRNDTGCTNMPVAVRFPASFVAGSLAAGFLGTLPGAIVVAADGSVVAPVLRKRMHGLLPVVPNDKDGAVNYYQLAKIDAKPQESQPGDPDFAVRAERLLSERRFLEADAAAKRWTEAIPTSADAWEYKARLNVREMRGDEAAAAYRKALELDPGRIDVVTAFADYLMTTGKAEDEAREMLDRYAKAFPLNREIALAQARWLDHRGMRADARAILKDWVGRQPDNIDIRVALHNYLNEAPERYDNLQHIIGMVAPNSQNLMWFRRKIDDSGLLTFPESSAAFDFLRRVAKDSKNGLVRRNYMSLMPLEQPVVENFSESGLSDSWEVFGNNGVLIGGEFLLPGLPDPSESNLRLKRSDLIRDGFVEARIGESLGAFWLYARRSAQGMVRFGFDSDGFLRIQAWQNGEPRVLDSVLWVRPKDDLTLRLEIRGDGAIGCVNGRNAFSTPLAIPGALGYGWWGVAASASETGMAQTRIKVLSSGPLRPTVVVTDLLPVVREDGTSVPAPTRDVLEALRERAGDVGVIAPVVGQQAVDRSLSSPDARSLDCLRVFARYHRLRLMPVVDLGYYNDPEPSDVIAYMKKSGLDGLCLRVRRLPGAEWCAKMEKALEALFANVVLVQCDKPLAEAAEAGAEVVLHELQRGSLYLQTGQATWETQAEKFEKWKTAPAGADRTGAKPMLVVMPRGRED
jgi:tetratricopeptide (TPR) repeat protein